MGTMKNDLVAGVTALLVALAGLASCDQAAQPEDTPLPPAPAEGGFFAPAANLAAGKNTRPGDTVLLLAKGYGYSLVKEGALGRDNDRFVIGEVSGSDAPALKVAELADHPEGLESGAWYVYMRVSQGNAAMLLTASFFVAEKDGPEDFGFEQADLSAVASVNKAGYTAGTFADPDTGTAPFFYILTSGNGENDADNRLFQIQENSLLLKTTLTEVRDYHIYVRVADSAENIFQKEVILTLREHSIPDAAYIEETMILIPGTTITGSARWGIPLFPFRRTLTIDSFLMSKYEISYGQWREVMQWATAEERGENRYAFVPERLGGPQKERSVNGEQLTGGNRNLPVGAYFNWRDAVVWCNALSEYAGLDPVYYLPGEDGGADTVLRASSDGAPLQPIDRVKMDKTKSGYRLPVEAEWEFAARGGDPDAPDWTWRWAGTDDPNEVGSYAWTGLNTLNPAEPVGAKKPNRLGLHDMTGNAPEWCWDWVDGTGTVQPGLGIDGPSVPPANSYNRSLRDRYGYSATDVASLGVGLRGSASPNAANLADSSLRFGGFRIVRRAN